MRKIISAIGMAMILNAVSVHAQTYRIDSSCCKETQVVFTEDATSTLVQVCRECNVPVSIDLRRKAILVPLKRSGIPFPWHGTYKGTLKQNEKLKLAMLSNKHLIIDGKLSIENAKLWNWHTILFDSDNY